MTTIFKPMVQKFEGTISVTGYWFGKTPEQIIDVIDDALHRASMCACKGSGAGYVISAKDDKPKEKSGHDHV